MPESGRGQEQSPLSGEAGFPEQQRERMARRRALPAPAAAVPGSSRAGCTARTALSSI